mmetsp:Transcript_34559/g.88437  ORF Transcript_34559/g.88437 Transcript_34559/m.88437 type:complete len:341 (+) Transcript_34559:968-1990(+)
MMLCAAAREPASFQDVATTMSSSSSACGKTRSCVCCGSDGTTDTATSAHCRLASATEVGWAMRSSGACTASSTLAESLRAAARRRRHIRMDVRKNTLSEESAGFGRYCGSSDSANARVGAAKALCCSSPSAAAILISVARSTPDRRCEARWRTKEENSTKYWWSSTQDLRKMDTQASILSGEDQCWRASQKRNMFSSNRRRVLESCANSARSSSSSAAISSACTACLAPLARRSIILVFMRTMDCRILVPTSLSCVSTLRSFSERFIADTLAPPPCKLSTPFPWGGPEPEGGDFSTAPATRGVPCGGVVAACGSMMLLPAASVSLAGSPSWMLLILVSWW